MAKDEQPDFIVISWETAEYLAILNGQTNWGNPTRAGKAAHELGMAMQGHPMTNSLDCFAPHKKGKP